MTIRVQWADVGIQPFDGMDFHDNQWDEALQECARRWPHWAVMRILLIGDKSDDWVVLADSDGEWLDGRV